MGDTQRSAVIFDRQPVCLDAVAKLLAEDGVAVAGRTTVLRDAVALIETHLPDLLVAGIDISDDAELFCLRRAHLAHSGLASVVVADSDDPCSVESAFHAGATIYCLATAAPDDVVLAIRQAFRRSIFFAGTHASVPYVDDGRCPLTRREKEILQLVAEGSSNVQIARQLWVTDQTVKFHLSNIYRKLKVANRTEASRWAHLHGLLSPRRPAHAVALATQAG